MTDEPVKGFPSNSKNIGKAESVEPEPEREKLASVVASSPKQRKAPWYKRISGELTNDDAQGVGQYILMDIIIPSFKNLLVDSISQGAERMFLGDTRHRTRPGQTSSNMKTNYGAFSKPAQRVAPAENRRAESMAVVTDIRGGVDTDNLVFDNRGDAEIVLQGMIRQLTVYNWVSLADLLDLCGQTSKHTDYKWGWTDLTGSHVIRAGRSGYILNLPTPESIG